MLREGAAADVIVYDYEKLDYEFPTFRHDLPGDEYRIASAGTVALAKHAAARRPANASTIST